MYLIQSQQWKYAVMRADLQHNYTHLFVSQLIVSRLKNKNIYHFIFIMLAVKLFCLNIIEVGNTNPFLTKIKIIVNSLPYSLIEKGENAYLCIDQQKDTIELEWPSNQGGIKKQIPRECIRASTVSLTPFWMEFDANPHFIRVQLKMIVLNKNKHFQKQNQKGKQVMKMVNIQSLNPQEDSSLWPDIKNSGISAAFCEQSERTLNDLQSERQKILQSLFYKIKGSV